MISMSGSLVKSRELSWKRRKSRMGRNAHASPISQSYLFGMPVGGEEAGDRNDTGCDVQGKSRSRSPRLAQARLHRLIPGGAHTYARGSDQYPERHGPGAGSRARSAG